MKMGKVVRNEKNVTLTSENSMAVSYKIKHTNLIVPSNLLYIFTQEKWSPCHAVYGSFINKYSKTQNTQKLKTKNN